MCVTDVGYNPVIRFCDFAQVFDFTGVVGTHFHDAEFRVCIHAEQGERNPDMVIQITFGGNGFVLFREYGMA